MTPLLYCTPWEARLIVGGSPAGPEGLQAVSRVGASRRQLAIRHQHLCMSHRVCRWRRLLLVGDTTTSDQAVTELMADFRSGYLCNWASCTIHCTSHRIPSHRTTSHHSTAHPFASGHIASHHIASHRIASHRIASHHITPHYGGTIPEC